MIRINLLPVRAAKKKETRRFQLTVAGLVTFLVVAVLAVVYITLRTEASSVRSEIRRGEQELASLKAKVGELSKIKEQKRIVGEKLAIIKNLEAARTGPTELFMKISNAIPEKAWINNLRDQGHIITLKGFAESEDVISNFMRGLEEYPELGMVELDVAQRVTEPETKSDVVSFTLKLEKRQQPVPKK